MQNKLPPSFASSNKLLGIEVIRFVTALAVLIHHYRHFTYISDKPIDFSKELQPFYTFLQIFYDHGYLGVKIFWCISGFIFFWKYRDSLSSREMRGKRFFVLRFSRLYPLHIATLVLVAALQLIYLRISDFYFVYQYNSLPHFILQMFLASDWILQKEYSFNGPIWSVSVEALIYFLFFMILRFVGKSALINIAILGLCAAARIANISHPVVDCVTFFYIGGLSAILSQTISDPRLRVVLNTIAWGVVCLAPAAAWALEPQNSKFYLYFFLTIYIPTLLFCLSGYATANTPTQRIIEAAGNMTYSSYLLHFPIQLILVIGFTFSKTPIPFYNPLFFLLFMTVTLVLSYLTYRYFEAPAQAAIRAKLA